VVKKDFPKVHFYDQDLVALYDETWILAHDFWKKGTSANGLHSRYFAHPDSTRINQFTACFATFFLVYSNRIYPVFPLLDNFYSKQESSGAIRGEYGEKDGKPIRSRDNPKGVLPPLFAWAEYNIYHKLGAKKRIREVLPVLERYYEWIEESFRRENGLYSVPLAATFMENSPREGMCYPIDFNSQMALAAFYMSELADIVNDKDTNYKYKKAYFSLKTKINTLMWDEKDGFYFDLDRNEKRLKTKTIASFWPLLAEIPNEARGEQLIEHLVDPREFGIENPFPTLAVKDRHYDPIGMGFRGSVYPPFNYMVIKGLEKYRRHDLAREFAIRHIYHVLDGLYPNSGKKGSLYEAYAPHTEGPAKWPGKKGFPRTMFLPSTALTTVSLMLENIIGLDISLPRKTVNWTIPTLEHMGIEDLALKRNLISILNAKSGRGWEIHLESEKLYYLTIDLFGARNKTLPIPSGKCSILVDKI
jgi:neutral trehalase